MHKLEVEYTKNLFHAYFKMQMDGCGNGKCLHRGCASSRRNAQHTRDPNQAVANSMLWSVKEDIGMLCTESRNSFCKMYVKPEDGPETNELELDLSLVSSDTDVPKASTPRKNLLRAIKMDKSIRGDECFRSPILAPTKPKQAAVKGRKFSFHTNHVGSLKTK